MKFDTTLMRFEFHPMFIDEQHCHLELQPEFQTLEQMIHSPASRRWDCWTLNFHGNRYGRRLWG